MGVQGQAEGSDERPEAGRGVRRALRGRQRGQMGVRGGQINAQGQTGGQMDVKETDSEVQWRQMPF